MKERRKKERKRDNDSVIQERGFEYGMKWTITFENGNYERFLKMGPFSRLRIHIEFSLLKEEEGRVRQEERERRFLQENQGGNEEGNVMSVLVTCTKILLLALLLNESHTRITVFRGNKSKREREKRK